MTNFIGTGKRLTQFDIGNAAKEIGISTAVLLSFLEVEAAGRGFDNQNRVKILPEAHVFYRNLKGALRSTAVSMGIAYKKWVPGNYNFDKYVRLSKMIKLAREAGFRSASYGLSQILGENHLAAGHKSAEELWKTAKLGEREQLLQMVTLMKSWGMVAMLTGKNFDDPEAWRTAAKKWNGSGYARHGYHTKLAAAHRKHSRNENGMIVSPAIPSILRSGMRGETVRNYQADLQALGYKFENGVDGRFGPETLRNTKLFQKDQGLIVDGVAGSKTLRKLDNLTEKMTLDVIPEFTKSINWVDLINNLFRAIFQ